ncbi:helix-turn-helix domain-containing protein [Methylophilaceae bacterium]|nr:helix-turn-helix domain-containing protein [Methylophilaceae bacterium]MDC1281208.1 helix-turn-helix domain-containing protein [Methylophilaceae bacterium]
MTTNPIFIYNGALLLKERKKQKISRSDIAQQLTLHEDQIKSIEEQLPHGFANDHFRALAIKRYAFILALPIKKIIPPDVPADTEQSIVEDIQKIGLSKFVIVLLIAIVLIIAGSIFVVNIFSDDDVALSANADAPPNLTVLDEETDLVKNDLPIVLDVPEQPVLPTDITEKKVAPKVASDTPALSFICTIATAAPLTNFSTKLPEKPATYFHLVSTQAQTICTLDANNTLATYTLSEGEKLTHRGLAPFKIQLDPARSQLYFEGWKVQLQDQDIFIKLNPSNGNALTAN